MTRLKEILDPLDNNLAKEPKIILRKDVWDDL